MHKKINIKPIAITLIVVGFLYFIKTQFPHYRVSSKNMMPAVLYHDVVLVSKWSELKNNDIAVYQTENGNQISRVVAIQNDVVELKDGVLLINNIEQNAFPIMHKYRVLFGNHSAIAYNDLLMLLTPVNEFEEYTASLTDDQFEQIKKLKYVNSIQKIIHPKGYYNANNNPIFNSNTTLNWSLDNFGPLTVPNNCYFMIGDNRHQSIDSRFVGFIKSEDIVGVVAFKLYSAGE